MDMLFRISWSPRLLPGEQILSRVQFGRASFRSRPTYRWYFPMPPLAWGARLYVTNRRVLVLFQILPATQEVNYWFPGKENEKSPDIIRSVEARQVGIFGQCLEIISEDIVPHWYRQPRMIPRFYTRQAPELCRLIASHLD